MNASKIALAVLVAVLACGCDVRQDARGDTEDIKYWGMAEKAVKSYLRKPRSAEFDPGYLNVPQIARGEGCVWVTGTVVRVDGLDQEHTEPYMVKFYEETGELLYVRIGNDVKLTKRNPWKGGAGSPALVPDAADEWDVVPDGAGLQEEKKEPPIHLKYGKAAQDTVRKYISGQIKFNPGVGNAASVNRMDDQVWVDGTIEANGANMNYVVIFDAADEVTHVEIGGNIVYEKRDTTSQQKPEPKSDQAPKEPGPPPKQFRNWTSANGDFTIKARWVGAVGGGARLNKQDGEFITVSPDKLSEADRLHIEAKHHLTWVSGKWVKTVPGKENK